MKPLLSLILFVLCSCSSEENRLEPIDINAKEYLSSNMSLIDYEQIDSNAFSILDQDIEQYQLIFTGEAHANSANQQLNIALLKYLKETINIKYYLDESSYSSAYLLNQYLINGDVTFLDLDFKLALAGGARFATQERYQFWQDLYEYNQTLPTEEQIAIVGIDANTFAPFYAILHLFYLLPDSDVPSELQTELEALKNIKALMLSSINAGKNLQGGSDEVKAFYDETLLPTFDDPNKTELLQQYLGEARYEEYSYIIEQIKIAYIISASPTFMSTREPYIHQNFLALYSKLPEGRYYGQWGSSHVFQRGTDLYGVEHYIADYIDNEIPALKGKVLSIFYVYENCQGLENNSYKLVDLEAVWSPLYSEDILRYLHSETEKNMAIYRLSGEGSPFNEQLHFKNSVLMSNTQGVTSDYFQYLISIKGFTAETKIAF